MRLILPPIYNFDPKFFVMDTETKKCQLIVSDELFNKKSKCFDLSRDELRYKSPEELLG